VGEPEKIEETYRLLTATYEDGTVEILGEGGLYRLIINGQEVPLVGKIDINFSPRCLPVMTIERFVLREEPQE